MQTKIPFGILVMKFIKIEEIQGKQIIFDESYCIYDEEKIMKFNAEVSNFNRFHMVTRQSEQMPCSLLPFCECYHV
jgi:hypothetical protein